MDTQKLVALTRQRAYRRHEARADAALRSKTITISLVARSPRTDALAAHVAGLATRPPHQRQHLTYQEFGHRFGADQDVLDRISAFATGHGLQVVQTCRERRRVLVRGTFARLCELFQVEPLLYRGKHRSFRGPIQVAEALAADIETVIGLESRPVAEPHACLHQDAEAVCIDPARVAERYRFPDGDGAGQRIGIVLLGGGFHQSDLDAFFSAQGLASPVIVVHELDGAKNNPADAEAITAALQAAGITCNYHALEQQTKAAADYNSAKNIQWTIEAALDIELAGALANGAELHVYFTSNDAQGKYDALTAALEHDCSVISCSWGGHESGKDDDYLQLMEKVLQQAACQGITVCCASGDDGILDYPASSPHALACGGTHLHAADGTLLDNEAVWNEGLPVPTTRRVCSSGGVSVKFPEPSWQSSADVTGKTGLSGRGAPDVAAKADLKAGFYTVVGGNVIGMGGTSAATPLWAALVARINQRLTPTRVGYLTPLLYQPERAAALQTITSGYTGTYGACSGWDPCTGLGSPIGSELLTSLQPPS